MSIYSKKLSQFITSADLTHDQKETALLLGWYKAFTAFPTMDEATKEYYQDSSPESGARFSEQAIDAAAKNLRNTEIYLKIMAETMNSEFGKLSEADQRICLSRGYDPLYRDYATVDEAMAQVNAVALDANSRQIDITGAIRAAANTIIVAVRKEVNRNG